MGEYSSLIAKHQNDLRGPGSLTPYPEAQSDAV